MQGMILIGLGAVLFMLGIISAQVNGLRENNWLVQAGVTVIVLACLGVAAFLMFAGLVVAGAPML